MRIAPKVGFLFSEGFLFGFVFCFFSFWGREGEGVFICVVFLFYTSCLLWTLLFIWFLCASLLGALKLNSY